MKKIVLSTLVLFGMLVLTGCTENTEVTTDTQTSGVVDQASETQAESTAIVAEKTDDAEFKSFGIESCDRYIKFLQCVMVKMPFGGDAYKDQINTLEKERRTEVDQKTLQEACDGLVKIMEQGQESFKEIGCSI